MGHLRSGQGVYGRLQKRLDRFPIGAPSAPALYEILRQLYTEEEAEIASRMPIRFTDIAGIARRTGKSPEALLPLLDRMAEKGLVMDFPHKGKTLYFLSPTLLGFFEFAYMRVRDDIPQKELARHMMRYVHDDPEFVRSIFAGKVMPGRTLVHEGAVDPEDLPRVLDHERASHLIEEAKMYAVSLCFCRHAAEHEGRSCDRPTEVCTTFNATGDFLVRRGLARKIEREEAKEIFAQTREAGLVHIVENVIRRPAFVCHCCGCCCGMLSAINRFRLFDAVVTSPFLAAVDPDRCNGCGLCEKKCPIHAIEIRGEKPGAKADVRRDICLGCGLCHLACVQGAMRMEPRKEQILVPENTWQRTVIMAIEQGKFQNLLFDDFDRLDYAVLRAIMRIVTALPPVKKALLSRQVQSRFLRALAG
ncbi:MAG: 4Fe-4S dicluster domain-containing protein [Deltaproteobacteria bacterium]|nr:4Fe-4S dicluster domain-containing protein [Deltaproteobacteria bacterium]MDH3383473.1 4Fe-4S dicluster domain-containing protein [Deltaproteobacteria bacterium]